MKLLVVEDEKPAAAALERGLGEEGFAVDVAADAAAACEAVAVYEYDVIILDVRNQDGKLIAVFRGKSHRIQGETVKSPIGE